MKQTVIFDMDGVLVDTEYFYFKRRIRFIQSKNIIPSSMDLNDYVGLCERDTWEKLVPNNFKLRKELKKEYSNYRDKYPIDFKTVKNSDVDEIFSLLKSNGLNIAIASSSPRKEIERMMSECKITSMIDFSISGDEVKFSKPNPEIYQVVSRHFGGKIVAVEDSPVGIIASQQAGIFTLGLQTKYLLDTSQANEQIKSLKELTKFIDLKK